MQRYFAPLAALTLLAATTTAQCFEQNLGVLAPYTGGTAGAGDDDLFDLQPMNITFPMGGLSASYTHAHVCTNGVIYLTNGAASGGTTYAYQTVPFMVGAAGSTPRIAPLWVDLLADPALYGGGVFINNTIPGKFVVTWSNVVEWYLTTTMPNPPKFTIQAQLFANGDVKFFYSGSTYGVSSGFGSQFDSRVCVSEGNGVADPGAVDLSAGGNVNLATLVMYETFPLNVFDLQSSTLEFINTGTGYVQTLASCVPAYHETYGSGCYDISNSLYQELPDSSTAPTFNGQSMVFTPVGSEYLVSWGGATYVAPVAATNLGITDDGEVAVTPSIPFPTSGGPVAQLWVAGNGIVSLATNPDAGNYIPDPNTFLNCPVTAWWSHHDYNAQEAGSGQIVYHEGAVGPDTIAYITWAGVESYPGGGVLNPSTLQFQFNLSTGAVAMVWVTLDNNTTSIYGSGHLIGWSPGGPSTDAGSLTLATALPFVTNSTNVFALALTASPAPISSTVAGTNVTWTTSNMRELSPGYYLGATVLSLGQDIAGTDLGSLLGAPGCKAHITTLDYIVVMTGPTSTNSMSLFLPPNLPIGVEIYGQSINVIPWFSLPNGQNPGGYISSNAIKSYIAPF
jgi:hypothetical protein